MELSLPLDQMTTDEKLKAIDMIWEDLLRKSEEIPSPHWHAELLEARAQRVSEGKSRYIEWNQAKQDIRNRLR